METITTEDYYELAANAWKKENYPIGTEIRLDNNICECESYIMGETRCSCGNRRISTGVDGTLGNFYLMLEPY